MKNIYTFIACMIIACNSLFAQLNDVVSFNVNQLKFTTVDSYKKVAFDDCSFTSQIGAPELPYLVINYVIPFDKRVASITISDSTNQAISGTYMIYPAQPQNPINEPPPAFVEPISSIYSSNTKYPSTVIEIASQQYDKGYHIVTLHIYPLSYIPKDKRLSLFTNIAFILNYENEANPPIKPKSQSEFMYNVVRNQIASMVKNSSDIDQMDGKPQRIVSNSEQLSMINSSASSSDNIKPIYIIITNNTDVNGASVPKYGTKSMTDIFNELAIWKTKKGVPTVVVTVDEIKEQTTGCDLQEQIHNFLKDIWIESGTTYILFGGDVNIVPVRFIAGGNYGLFPSDLYYTAVESDWNANGNNIFGENNGDKSDITSEFYFGRAAVENGNEANTFVSKVLEYEKLSDELGINQDYVNNYLFMAAYITVDRDSTGQINYVSNYDIENVDNIVDKIKLGSNKWRLYDEYKCEGQTEGAYSRDDELNSINVINNLNDGQPFGKFHIAYHLDHSGYNGMGTSSLLKNETLYRDDMDNLSNNSYWQILYTNGCSPGEFDKDCIVERYLNNPNGGGVAAMASSDASYASERKFFENILKHIGKISYNGPANFNIGIVHNSSLELLGNTWEKRKNHLFGDPEMPIWTETPKSLDGRVSLSSNTISNVNTSLTVTVSNIDTKNVNVCLSKNGDIYEIGWTLSNSQSVPPYTKVFNFELDPQTPGNLDITVTAHNYIPYETSIPVNITGNNLYVSGNSIMDVNGNSNQQLDAGETANLNITLKNNGTTLISDVDVRLQCLTSDVIVDVNSAEYGDIAKNSSATRSDFRITLPSDITAGEVVNFKLYITGSGDYRATKKISYKVGSAEIKAIQNRYTQSGNTYTLFVDTFNSGSSDAVGVKGTLSAVEDNSSGTTIETSTVEYGTIKRLKTKNSTTGFKFTASPYSNQEFVVTFKDKYGKTWTTQPFNLVRPTSVISNISFTSTERSISLIWKPIPTNQKIIGYNVYRSLAENGTYTKLNPAPFATASMYSDNGLTPKTYYYYRISYVDNSGNESAMSSPTMAWTTLPFHDGWPIENSAIGFRISGSPNVIDIDNDGKKELFFAATSWGDKNIPAIFGFKHNGEELYDIDNNPTTLSGFAKFDENTYSTPALADIDNDGKIELVVSTGESGEKTYAYKITNIPNSPQLM